MVLLTLRPVSFVFLNRSANLIFDVLATDESIRVEISRFIYLLCFFLFKGIFKVLNLH